MAAGLQVFGQPASTDVARVLTCLFEKNLEFELVRIDTFKTHHKLPEFIRLRVWHLHQFFLFLFVLSFGTQISSKLHLSRLLFTGSEWASDRQAWRQNSCRWVTSITVANMNKHWAHLVSFPIEYWNANLNFVQIQGIYAGTFVTSFQMMETRPFMDLVL